jgi:membrane-associated protease RseP (regulator of RpoE activity)
MGFIRRYKIHIILFILTFASTFVTGGLKKDDTGNLILSIGEGISYSMPVILILLGHEMGHYLMSRRYGIRATLPFFLPFPFSPFGTLGAVIRMESTIPSRKALFDVGAAGPLTSFVLSIPAILIGLRFSHIIPVSQLEPEANRLGAPLIFSLVQRLVMGEVPEGFDVILHPLGFAGWAGLFVTALNLLPVGQLDGGHVAYALFGRRSRLIFLIAIALMAFITIFYYPGWILLLILFVLFGLRHPAPLDDGTPLDGKRKVLGGIMLLIFLISFTPAPLPEVADEFRRLFHWF